MVGQYEVFSDQLTKISLTSKLVINTINQFSYCIARKDEEFSTALKQSNILLPDGMAIVKASRFLTGKKITKIAGTDLHNYLLEQLQKISGTCFYLGSSEDTLSRIKIKLAAQYPQIHVYTYSPPFKKNFSNEDNKAMVEAVNNCKPDILFIGLTAPKQEKWAFNHKELLQARLICSIGAVFDFYAETIKRANMFWIKLGMEWLIRLIKQPRHMWKRYLYYGPVFILHIIIFKFRTNLSKQSIYEKEVLINLERALL